ncbi:MAG TPA: sigma-70 family RNA polymerase sigma factor [Pyrinomonadaceae bacterium]|nr:sigma-70 family RNA polymerase sigma factor [Pyrinomonadaceae bacterium]
MSSADFHASLSPSNSATHEKAKWSLSKDAFEKLLNSFSTDREEAGAQYELIRRKLVRFFEWRALESADEHADETINRVARRIDEGQSIENLKGYFYGVARMVFMEALRDRERAPLSIDDAPQSLREKVLDEAEEPEARVLCLDKCLEALSPSNRGLILNYYQEERRAKIDLRQELADRLQIPLNALRIRAHRIRMSLEKCITNCLQSDAGAK